METLAGALLVHGCTSASPPFGVLFRASNADMVSGAIWAGVRYCSTRLPGWLCSKLGNVLTSWSNVWGWAGNHGVWGAVYWNGITGGRW